MEKGTIARRVVSSRTAHLRILTGVLEREILRRTAARCWPLALGLLAGCGSGRHAASPGGSSPAAGARDDALALAVVRSAQAAAETIAVDANGNYSGVNAQAIHKLAPTVPITRGAAAYLSRASGAASTYVLTATSASGDTFTITRRSDGSVQHACSRSASSECRGGRW